MRLTVYASLGQLGLVAGDLLAVAAADLLEIVVHQALQLGGDVGLMLLENVTSGRHRRCALKAPGRLEGRCATTSPALSLSDGEGAICLLAEEGGGC